MAPRSPHIRPLSGLPQFGATRGGGRAIRIRPRHYALLVVLLPLLWYLFLRRSRDRIPFHYPLDTPTTNTSFSPTPARQIPPYVHYVFGLSPNFGGRPYEFMQYLCMMSALITLKPEVIYMHHVYPPTGFFWDEFVGEVERSGTTRLEMVQQRDMTTVFGRPIEHFAHKADVLRLEALRDYGGVYLDSDVLVVRDLAPLYKHQVVMGMESQPNLDPHLPPSGLCNAVILAKPYSSFVSRWLETYRSFDLEVWAGHSVTKPWHLAQQFPMEITVLNKFAFFWPIWHDDHLRLVHRGMSYNFHKPSPLSPTSDSQFTYHLWESFAWERYLSYYDPDRIHNRGEKKGAEREEDGRSDESSFSREARRFVNEGFRERWREAKRLGLL